MAVTPISNQIKKSRDRVLRTGIFVIEFLVGIEYYERERVSMVVGSWRGVGNEPKTGKFLRMANLRGTRLSG